MRHGSASDKLIVLAAQVFRSVPLIAETPVDCSAFTDPRATRSIVPVADGNKVRFPTTFRSAPKEVARISGGSRDAKVSNGWTVVSFNRSQGWNDDALG